MLKLIKNRFRIHFSGVIIFFLSSTMIIVAIAAMISLRNLGFYTVSKLKENITKDSTDFFLENTIYKAQKYSNTLNKVSTLIRVLSQQAAVNIKTNKQYNFDRNSIQAYCDKFQRTTSNGPLINVSTPHVLVVYTGKEKKVPIGLKSQLYSYSFLNPLLKNVYLSNPNYLGSWIWFCDDNVMMVYSKKKSYRYILSTENGYKGFEKQIDIFSHDNYMGKVKSFKYNNIKGVPVISAVYGEYDKKGKLLFLTGIDTKMDILTNNIINNRVPVPESDQEQICKYINAFDLIISSTTGKVILSTFEGYNKKTSVIPADVIRSINDRLKGDTGLFNFTLDMKKYILSFSKISVNDWYLGVVVLEKNFSKAILNSNKKINNNFFRFELNFFLVFIFFLLLTILILVVFFRKYIVKPISKLRNDVFKMKSGNFNLTMKHTVVSEIIDLADSFNTLGHSVDENIKELKLEVEERNRRNKEMEIAKQIQQSVLPRVTSDFSGKKIRLFARVHPAQNVGGDFYDFFFLNKNRLALLVADVSGKGLSAAFYMAIAKSTIRNACINEPNDPAKALYLSNQLLCELNLKLFVSVFLIYYDLDTGMFQYGNAGHNEPVILRHHGENKFFGTHHDMVLGIFPDLKFRSGKEFFGVGDTIVLYTDGITEANAENEDYFGEKRLIEFLAKNKTLSAKNICRSLIAYVHNFEKGKQYDDMTVLAFKRNS